MTVAEAVALAAAGIAKAYRGADPALIDKMRSAVLTLCESRAFFFSDDVWQQMGEEPGDSARALGAVMLEAQRDGWCIKTILLKPSVHSRMGPKPVWMSAIWKNETKIDLARTLFRETMLTRQMRLFE